jgi:GT2 family glycosyltransferase/glycosyltransferase involved in cell wall biosynthesis
MTQESIPSSSTGPSDLTIVVPVYGDWESLQRCLESLVSFSDPLRHTVIIVNDCGPDVDDLEQAIEPYIASHENFHYFRNDRNLGFVGTCNRAVLELDESDNDVVLLNSDAELTEGALDELVAVLQLSERHGMVCPRSNFATIATIPARSYRANDRDGDPIESHAIFEAVRADLPRYYVSPVALGFCFLVRRSLIVNHGLFDEVFGVGYDEENDLCLRVNALGYSSLIANHAFVFHVGATSFGSEIAEHKQANSELLLERYPFYDKARDRFTRFGYSAADNFAAFVNAARGPRKILLDVHYMSLIYNGSTKNILTFLAFLSAQNIDDSIEITLAAQSTAIEVFNLRSFGFRTLEYAEVDELFDLGVALSPVTTFTQLEHLNRNCVRWLICHLDIIALRIWALSVSDPGRPLAVRDSLIYADRVVTISETTWRDTIAFFPELDGALLNPPTVIHQGSPRIALQDSPEPNFGVVDADKLRKVFRVDDDFVLIVGNSYPHKQVRRAVKELAGHGLKLVVLGSLNGMPTGDDVTVLASGRLSESDVATLYARAALVVFPSAYEGYGLPVPEALDHGTPVVAFSTEVVREVTRSIDAEDAVVFYDRFDTLVEVVKQAIDDKKLAKAAARHRGKTATITDFNQKLWATALETLAIPFDFPRLRDRYDEVQRISFYAAPLQLENAGLRHDVELVRSSVSYRLGNAIVRVSTLPIKLLRGRRKTLAPSIEDDWTFPVGA